MAGGQERVLRRRIKSVQSTKKITRAMELIAASRIRKAEDAVRAAVPYADSITEAVQDLAAAGGTLSESTLLRPRVPVRKIAFMVVSADRGLRGGYNSAVFRAAEGLIKEAALRDQDYSVISIGRKAESYFRFRNYRIDEAFSGFSASPTYEDARSISRALEVRFDRGDYDWIEMVYTRFVSIGTQEVVLRPLIPLEEDVMVGGDARPGTEGVGPEYEFEPDPTGILNALMPRYVEARLYAVLLNAAASEHAARQRAMKAATDNAEELLVNLTRAINRARQDSITTEINEIVGGAEALSGGEHGLGEARDPFAISPGSEYAFVGAEGETQ